MGNTQALPLTSPSGTEVPGGGTNPGLGLWSGPRPSARGPAPSPSGDYQHACFKAGGGQLDVPKAPRKEPGLWLAIGAVLRPGPQSLAALLSSSPTPDDLNQCDVLSSPLGSLRSHCGFTGTLTASRRAPFIPLLCIPPRSAGNLPVLLTEASEPESWVPAPSSHLLRGTLDSSLTSLSPNVLLCKWR